MQHIAQQELNSNRYTIAVQPIIDTQLTHVADELLYRTHASATTATITDDVQATARAIAVAIYEIGLSRLCGERKLFINASRDWLLNPDLTGLPTDQVVIEILETTSPTEELHAALAALCQQGYTLAMDDFETTSEHRDLLRYCKIVKFDISVALPLELIRELKDQGYTLLAERVETHEQFEHCCKLGFSLFQGYFYSRPRTQTTHINRLTSSQANQLQLLTQLYNDDVRLPALRTLIARDPYILQAIYRRANSAAQGLRQPVHNLEKCMQILGLKELRVLVTVVMMAHNSPVNRLNLVDGLTRAFACQQLALHQGADEESSFVAGLFSYMHIILNVDQQVMMDELPMDASIMSALKHRSGQLGELLNTVEAAEQGQISASFPADTLLNAAAKARSLLESDTSA